MVDEVQDFIPAQLQFLMELSQNSNGFVFGGDTCQTINVGYAFSFRDLQKMFMHSKGMSEPPRIFALSDNFRSHSGIVNFANRLVNLLEDTFPHSFECITDETGRTVNETSSEIGDAPIFIQVLDVLSEGLARQKRNDSESLESKYGGEYVMTSEKDDLEKMKYLQNKKEQIRKDKHSVLKNMESELIQLNRKRFQTEDHLSVSEKIENLQSQIQVVKQELDILDLYDMLRYCLRSGLEEMTFSLEIPFQQNTAEPSDVPGLPGARKFHVDRDIGLIIVRDDSSRNRIKHVMDGTILTPYEAKGLERDSIVVVDFFSHKDAGLLWSVASKEILNLGELIKQHTAGLDTLSRAELKKLHKVFPAIHEIKQLYVAVTRARKTCTFLQRDGEHIHKCRHFLDYCEGVVTKVDSSETFDIVKTTVVDSTSSEDRIQKARRIVHYGEQLWRIACDDELTKWRMHREAVGNFEQAEDILASIDLDKYSGKDEDIQKMAKRISYQKLRAIADYARCEASHHVIVSKKVISLREAAETYLQLRETERAASCFREAGVAGNDCADFKLSGLCYLLRNHSKNVQMALNVFLEGNMYLEAAALLETSNIFAGAAGLNDHQFLLQTRYLETFSECHLIISEFSIKDVESEVLVAVLNLTLDQIRLLDMFPEALLQENICSQLWSGLTESSPIAVDVSKVQAESKNLFLKLLLDDNSIAELTALQGNLNILALAKLFDLGRVRDCRLKWFFQIFKCCLFLAIKQDSSHFNLNLSHGTLLMEKFFDVAWESCKKKTSLLCCCYSSVSKLMFRIFLDNFGAHKEYGLQQVGEIKNSSFTNADLFKDNLLRYFCCLDCFCRKLLDKLHLLAFELSDVIPTDLSETHTDFSKVVIALLFSNLLMLHMIRAECTFQEGKMQLESKLQGKYRLFMEKAETIMTEDVWFQITSLITKLRALTK